MYLHGDILWQNERNREREKKKERKKIHVIRTKKEKSICNFQQKKKNLFSDCVLRKYVKTKCILSEN